MSNKPKSAKDLAFDRERLKFRKEIKRLKSEIEQRNNDISVLKNQLSSSESKCVELQDWVDRLLEYTDLSEEDMKIILKREKDISAFINNFYGLPTKLL